MWARNLRTSGWRGILVWNWYYVPVSTRWLRQCGRVRLVVFGDLLGRRWRAMAGVPWASPDLWPGIFGPGLRGPLQSGAACRLPTHRAC